jgi:hypothetical protein
VSRGSGRVGVDDPDEFVVEPGSGGVGVAGGVIALAEKDVDELDVGLVEPASLADGLEAAVQLERPGAVPVGEKPARSAGWVVVCGRCCGCGVGFDGLGGLAVVGCPVK